VLVVKKLQLSACRCSYASDKCSSGKLGDLWQQATTGTWHADTLMLYIVSSADTPRCNKLTIECAALLCWLCNPCCLLQGTGKGCEQ
jgi:hypothetical protein